MKGVLQHKTEKTASNLWKEQARFLEHQKGTRLLADSFMAAWLKRTRVRSFHIEASVFRTCPSEIELGLELENFNTQG